MKIKSHDLHVLVADANSPDKTQECVKALMPTYPNLHLVTGKKQGLGQAYKKSIDYALRYIRPDLIFEMDADLQHDPVEIPLFISLVNDYGFDLVIGSRFIPGGKTPGVRKKITWYSNLKI